MLYFYILLNLYFTVVKYYILFFYSHIPFLNSCILLFIVCTVCKLHQQSDLIKADDFNNDRPLTHNARCDSIYLVRRESNSGVYFAGMFRVANVEFIPEYRQAESREFVSLAGKIQHVVCIDVTQVFTRRSVFNWDPAYS